MIEPLFVVINLDMLAEEVRDHARHSELVKKLNQAKRAQSCLGDLGEATTMIEALRAHQSSLRNSGTQVKNSTETALLRQAIALYVRATATNGQQGERGSVSIQAKLLPDETDKHLRLVDARNRGLAHVYPGEQVAGATWNSAEIFLVVSDEKWKALGRVTSVQVDPTLADALEELIPKAIRIIQEQRLKRFNAVRSLVDQMDISAETLAKCVVPASAVGLDHPEASDLIKGSGNQSITTFFHA